MNMGLAVWRDISLIWLLLLTIISILPISIVLFFLVKGMHRLRQLVKEYLPLAQEMVRQVAAKVDEICDKIIAPFVSIYAAWARLNAITKTIFRRE
jgi:hypothetical protein